MPRRAKKTRSRPKRTRLDIAYVRLGGDVGIICNGAGLTMTTMDEVKRAGGNPADFLDVGGGAQAERVRACLGIVLSDPNVKGVLINIFGGITRCDEVAKGVIAATESMDIKVPIVVRLAGTRAEEGAAILAQSNSDSRRNHAGGGRENRGARQQGRLKQHHINLKIGMNKERGMDELDPQHKVELAMLRAEHQKKFQGMIELVKARIEPGVEYRNGVARVVVSDTGAYCELNDLPEEFAGAAGPDVEARSIAPAEAVALLARAVEAVQQANRDNARQCSILVLYSRRGSLTARTAMCSSTRPQTRRWCRSRLSSDTFSRMSCPCSSK